MESGEARNALMHRQGEREVSFFSLCGAKPRGYESRTVTNHLTCYSEPSVQNNSTITDRLCERDTEAMLNQTIAAPGSSLT